MQDSGKWDPGNGFYKHFDSTFKKHSQHEMKLLISKGMGTTAKALELRKRFSPQAVAMFDEMQEKYEKKVGVSVGTISVYIL